MKVSLNTVKQYTDVNLPVDELVHKINSQLGGVEEVIDLGAKYAGAIIVKIAECEKHPNADKLNVCKIDDGGVLSDITRDENGYVQVVCGAPNARAGITVVWLPPGSTVPESFEDKEPFVLGARELRGVVSNGMLASPKELGLGDSHDGILEIDDKKPGESFATAYGLDDIILDIENKMFTHRPDCFGVLGVAREIAGIQQQQFKSPVWYTEEPGFVSGDGLKLEVVNEIAEAVPRFMAVAIKDVEIKPSPLWLQIELVRLGGKPINNIVDVTNYCMLLTGQPLHAYDYDKLSSKRLGVRFARTGDGIELLSGKRIAWPIDPKNSENVQTHGDIMITDGDKPIGLAGIMGGRETEVSNATKNIILECATFDMYTIRKTSMRYGLFTDAVTRFNKGQSPLQNEHVLSLALNTIQSVAGGEVASQIFDQSDELKPHASLTVDVAFINERLGTKLKATEAAQLLAHVECKVTTNKDKLQIIPPFWRTDIELPEDVVEEVGRLYGFDRLPRELPMRSIVPTAKSVSFEAKKRIRNTLSRAGANEVLTYSFVHANLITKAEQDVKEAFRLSNALSPDLQYYRLSIIPSLLAHVHTNIKAGHDQFVLYEIGKVHGKSEVDEDGLPKEFGRVGSIFAANKKAAANYTGAPYYAAKRYASELLGDGMTFRPLDEAGYKDHRLFQQMIAPFDPRRSAAIYNGERLAGVVGEFKANVTRGFKMPEYSAGFELFFSALEAGPEKEYRPLSRFPSVTHDISLKVDQKVAYADIAVIVEAAVGQSDFSVDMRPLSLYQPDVESTKTVTFRLKVTSQEKTLSDKEVASLVDVIADTAAKKIGATRV